MSLSPLTFPAYRQPLPPAAVTGQRLPAHSSVASHSVRFSGVGDAVSAFIGLIDRNRAAELIASDGLGMLVPRTAVAAGFRGGDDARETLIREGAGLFCVAMLAGLSNQLMIRVLGNRVGVYNPHGVPAKAWISAKNLRVYSQLYSQALSNQSHRSIAQARQAFVSTVLDGLESGDRQLSIAGRLASLNTLAQKAPDGAVAEQALTQMVTDLHGEAEAPAKVEAYKKLWREGSRQGDLAALRQHFLDNGWGRLSKQGKEVLLKAFSPKTVGDSSALGTAAVDELAWARVNELNPKASEAERQAAFLKTRMQVSLHQLALETPQFARDVDQLALDHGLTSVVHLKNNAAGENAEILTGGQSRQTILKEMKAFLEHYVDRAGYEVKKALPAKGGAASDWGVQQQLMRDKLFAAPSKGLRGLFPQAEDGFVTAMLKAKTGYTLVPIAIAITANGISTFMNNYITQKKYGGRVFFPGEEAFLKGTPGAAPTTSSLKSGRLA